MSDMNHILEEQITYYQARATEYDEWFYRQGRYDQGQAENQKWFEEVQQVVDILHTIPKQRHILATRHQTKVRSE